MSDSPRELLALAEELAHEAGKLLMTYYPGGSGPSEAVGVSVRSKSTRTDLVTEADRASEQLIVGRLDAARAEDGILAEEGSARSGTSGLTWVIDPLDGTINFVYGFPAFAVSIGCQRDDGERVLGVVHDPVRDETFTALAGGGSARNSAPLHLPPSPPLSEALLATGFGYDSRRREAQARLLPTVLPAVRDIRRAGAAALDLCWMAAGRVDGCFESGLEPWDLAAGALVVEEAGGSIDIVDGIIPGAATVVASGPGLREPLLALLHEAVAAAGTYGATPPPEPPPRGSTR
ncbi:MAG: inositol monophosphatase family protein [Acidimicrobiales bacterium]